LQKHRRQEISRGSTELQRVVEELPARKIEGLQGDSGLRRRLSPIWKKGGEKTRVGEGLERKGGSRESTADVVATKETAEP